MGNTNLWYFSEEKLRIISDTNPYLEDYFNSVKNFQGFIPSTFFHTQILKSSVSKDISDKIFKLFSTSNRMNLPQLIVFYSALYSQNVKDKINLFSYLIFKSKTKLSFIKYKKRIKYFFYQSFEWYAIFINTHFINQILQLKEDNEEFRDDSVIEINIFKYFLLNDFIKCVDEITWVKEYTNYPSTKYEFICNCDNNKGTCNTGKTQEMKEIDYWYLNMKNVFIEKESENNGVYPISELTRLFNKVHINDVISGYIGKYLTNLTMKSFIDYDTFYKFITQFYRDNIIKEIFEILSFPDHYISGDTLRKVALSIDANYNIDQVKDKNFLLDFENNWWFFDLQNIMSRLITIPYKFFKQFPKNREIEYWCIQNYLNGKENLNDFFKEYFWTETVFYPISVRFWNNYINYLSHNLSRKPLLDIRDICNKYNVWNSKSRYWVDFYLITRDLFDFIKRNCNMKGYPLEVRKIQYKYNYQDINCSISVINPREEQENDLVVIDEKQQIKLEIEVHLIEAYWISLNQYTWNNKILDNDYNSLVKALENHVGVEFQNPMFYSKLTTWNTIKNKIINLYNLAQTDQSVNLYWLISGNWIQQDNLDETLMDKGFTTEFVFVLNLNESNERNRNENKIHTANPIIDNNDTNGTEINVAQGKQMNKIYYGWSHIVNNCFINSTSQILWQMQEIKDYFLSPTDKQLITTQIIKKNNFLQTISYQFYIWLYTIKKYDNPETRKDNTVFKWNSISWCKRIQEKNKQFSYETQQDASEFFQFLLDSLHNETKLENILKDNINNKDRIAGITNGNERKLMEWSYEIVNNPSIINSWFLFQTKTTITCKKCGTSTSMYETTRNLDIPIPLKNISVCLIFHPLPKKYKWYHYNSNAKDEEQGCVKNDFLLPITMNVHFNAIGKIKTIVDFIKTKKMLYLEQEPPEIQNENIVNNYTTFVIYSERFECDLDINHTINNYILPNDRLHIYELLNSNGLSVLNKSMYQVILYKQPLIEKKILNNNIIKNPNITHIRAYAPRKTEQFVAEALKNVINFEYALEIKHAVTTVTYPYLFNKYTRTKIPLMPGYILLNTSTENITITNLYEYILDKYSYLLSINSDFKPWWRFPNDTHFDVKQCYPFILKVIKKSTGNCLLCPWFRFCLGCSLIPGKITTMSQWTHDSALLVLWCSDLYNNNFLIDKIGWTMEIKPEEISDDNSESTQKNSTSWKEYIDLYLQEETLPDKLCCEACSSKEEKTKITSITILPKYLTITLKRFTSCNEGFYMNFKNESTISFPITNLTLNDTNYDLISVVNHEGNWMYGHYYSYIKCEGNKWKWFNDSWVRDIEEDSIVTKNAYILVYQVQEADWSNDNFVYYHLIRNYFIFQDQSWLINEPVYVDKELGYVKDAKFTNGQYIITVQKNQKVIDLPRSKILRGIDICKMKDTEENDLGCNLF